MGDGDGDGSKHNLVVILYGSCYALNPQLT